MHHEDFFFSCQPMSWFASCQDVKIQLDKICKCRLTIPSALGTFQAGNKHKWYYYPVLLVHLRIFCTLQTPHYSSCDIFPVSGGLMEALLWLPDSSCFLWSLISYNILLKFFKKITYIIHTYIYYIIYYYNIFNI